MCVLLCRDWLNQRRSGPASPCNTIRTHSHWDIDHSTAEVPVPGFDDLLERDIVTDDVRWYAFLHSFMTDFVKVRFMSTAHDVCVITLCLLLGAPERKFHVEGHCLTR